MTTQCFLHFGAVGTAPHQFSTGTNNSTLAGGTSGWTLWGLSTTRDSGANTTDATATVTGTTLGLEFKTSSIPIHWVSPPLSADVTISGTITFNIWASESSMTANVGAQGVIERIDSTGAVVSTVVNSEQGVELATTLTVQNWTAAPTSTAFNKGDRIRVRVAGNDGGGTMATGFTFQGSFGAASAGVTGDSYVTFTETFGFLTTDPTTTKVYPTTTASDVDAGITEREMWTAAGASVNSVTKTMVTGWTAPLQLQISSVDAAFYSKQLTAFTLSAPVLVNAWSLMASAPSSASLRADLSVCNSDGSSPTVWAATSHPTATTATSALYSFYLAGDDLAVTDGQRLRLRFFADDSSTTAMSGTDQLLCRYNGGTPGANGDTFLTFGQSLTEYVAAGKSPPFGANRHLSLNHLIRR